MFLSGELSVIWFLSWAILWFLLWAILWFLSWAINQSLLIIPHWEDWEKKELKKKKVECFVSIRKKTQKEGISISFLFQVNTTVLKHTVDFKRKQRNPTFSHILLGQPGHRSRNKERKTTRKRPNPTEGVP